MPTLTRDDWHLLTRGKRAFYALSSFVLDFDAARSQEVSGCGGGSMDSRDGRRGWYNTTAKGYTWDSSVNRFGAKPDEAELFVPWSKVKAWCQSLTIEQRDMTKALLLEGRALNRDYPNRHRGIGHQYAWDRKPRGTDAEVEADLAALAVVNAEIDIEVAAWRERKAEYDERCGRFFESLAPTLVDDLVLAQR